MDKLIDLLFQNPILLFLVGAWLVGMIGNAARAKNAAKGKDAARNRVKQRLATPAVAELPAATEKVRETFVGDLGAGQRAVLPHQRQAPASMRGARAMPAATSAATPLRNQSAEDVAREMRRVLGLEPDPRPVAAPVSPPDEPEVISMDPAPDSTRSADGRLVSHVGEGMRGRHLAKSKVGQQKSGRASMGSLGGRVHAVKAHAIAPRRYAMDDLRRAVVMSEILSPPVALRADQIHRPV